jgi:hypothetical protein
MMIGFPLEIRSKAGIVSSKPRLPSAKTLWVFFAGRLLWRSGPFCRTLEAPGRTIHDETADSK